MDERVRAVIAAMNANLHRKVTVSEMAATVYLSATHLSRLFKAETGASLARYRRELRMRRAGELLETTFLSVKEIAARIGIQSLNHFVTDFKKAHRVTPRQYASRYRRAVSPQAND